ncbi:MAG: Asp-tRNA(Asn)/Glu-tRNA(Gln) amidotransferase subunit GatC [Bacillota bacterium]
MSNIAKELNKAIEVIKIEVSTSEQEQLQEELKSFLQWVEPVLELNTLDSGQTVFSHEAVNVLREDQPCQGELAEQQDAAPNFAGGYYLVPKIIE